MPDSSPMTPKILVSWRLSRALSQAKLASLLRVTRATINRWERGRCKLPESLPATLAALEPYFHPWPNAAGHPDLYLPRRWDPKRRYFEYPKHPAHPFYMDHARYEREKAARIEREQLFWASLEKPLDPN